MNTDNHESFRISTDKSDLDMDTIMEFMHTSSYWARNRDRQTMQKAVDNSLCFGIFLGPRMVGFARVVTDYATMYYLCDVFINPADQGKGLGRNLIEAVLNAPELSGLYGMLLTRDAHRLYRKFGFTNEEEALKKFMIKRDWAY